MVMLLCFMPYLGGRAYENLYRNKLLLDSGETSIPFVLHPKSCFLILCPMGSSFSNNPKLHWAPQITQPILESRETEKKGRG